MRKKLLQLATLALLFTGVASAQTTGSITGVVTDGASGKPVVGAVVVATSPAAPGEQTAVTDAKGAFTIANLPPGKYALQATVEGYKPETRSDLVLGENVTLRANLAVVPEAIQLEEVVVTGSRIKRKDLTTPAPVTVVSKEQMTSTGKVSLGEFLQQMPEQAGANNAQVNNGTDGAVRVDLRQLGAQRTLVLVNGRRFVGGGGGADASVDLSTIPVAAVERIEILKDGASAVYGSDAISGVVNVILKKRFSGTEVSAFAGTSSRGDGNQYDFSAITGSGNEKGNFLFSVGYTKMESILAGDRKWAETSYGYGPFDLTGDVGKYPTGNSSTFPDGRFSLPSGACPGGSAPPGASQQVIDACNARADALANIGSGIVVPTPGGTAAYAGYDGSLYNTNPTNFLITPSQKLQLFTTGDVSLSGAARLYYEASYNKRNSAWSLAPMPLVNNTIPTNPVKVSASSLYNPFGVDITSWRKRMVEFGDRYESDEAVTFRVVTGLDGALGDWAGPLRGWSWDVSYNYGNTTATGTLANQLRMPNVANAVGPSMLDPVSGAPICVRVPGDASTKINGCVPMDVLHGAGNIAGTGDLAALKSYVSFDGTSRGFTDQQVVSASLAGDLVKLMADRPAGLAVGVDYRYESGGFLPDVITSSLESSGNNQLPTQGSYHVTETYGELVLPLLNNMPGVEDLELQFAGRYVDYNTFGGNFSYKVGGRYTPVKDVTLRSTYSTAFRAPNVAELFGGTADNYPTVRDPCRTLSASSSPTLIAQCTAAGVPAGGTRDPSTQLLQKQGSNPDLQPEKAKIFTMGAVIEPRYVPNLSMTLDYYTITVDKAISLHGTSTILTQCYTQGNDAYCPMVIRDPNTHLITYVADMRGNLSQYKASGIDVGLRYALQTAAAGRFNFGFDANYLIKNDTIDETGGVTKGKGNYDNGVAMPSVRALGSLGWSLGGLSAGAQVRYVGSIEECIDLNSGVGSVCSTVPEADQGIRRVPAYYPVNLNVGYALKSGAGTTSIVLGVQNVADLTPPYLYNASAANSDPYSYDYVGRYFYGRLTQTF